VRFLRPTGLCPQRQAFCLQSALPSLGIFCVRPSSSSPHSIPKRGNAACGPKAHRSRRSPTPRIAAQIYNLNANGLLRKACTTKDATRPPTRRAQQKSPKRGNAACERKAHRSRRSPTPRIAAQIYNLNANGLLRRACTTKGATRPPHP
jgi:hypothetical protein